FPLSSSPHRLSRRSALRALGGAAALAAVPGALSAACSSSDQGASSGGGSTNAGGGSASGPITFGSNYSDAAPNGAFAALTDAATAQSSVKININTVDHNPFQNNISNYLQGTPDDLATWFAGYRLQFFAAQNLLEPIDDVWDKIGGTFNDAAKS